MTDRVLKSGQGWRLGWNPQAEVFKGLLGGDDWAIEVTEAELDDFCRLLGQLADTMGQIASELMDEEKIACEVESDWLWMQAEGYADAYRVQFILNSGRRCEGAWTVEAVPGLLQASQILKMF